ncbi:MAG: 5'/3'-nucleotidase SurE [Chlamydiia bacterium]|nr:5'/3'-nucleotidase SurE [Chlamydiia bacterium]
MMEKMHLLLTNDDGIDAPGIAHLFDALSSEARISIVAPAKQQSGMGLAITVHSPLRVEKREWVGAERAFSVSGTPADCVKLALSHLLPSPPDLIISGINQGSNSGRNVLYSGTIGGAIEGVMKGIPSMALSSYELDDPDFTLALPHILPLVHHLISHPLEKGTLLNINFPPREHAPNKGLKWTRQGLSHWSDNPYTHEQSSFWLGHKYCHHDEHEESDIYWLDRGFTTVVPLYVQELTNLREYEKRKQLFETSFNPPCEK